ncbi:MAG: flagellar hook-associated protein 3 FlgL [Microbacteriaceae bacterium]|jgi:flagellar hook-associated protein 3 FlgL|nr:flagellar hook-associated protein 3 FlgL [Microbacteriaceae bacterium]
MSFRVTNETQLAAAQRNLQASQQKLYQLDAQASTGLRITVPSDDPTGTSSLLKVQQQLAQNTQYQRNAQDGTGWLTTTSTTLSSVNTALTQLRDLTLQAANTGTSSPSSQSAISDQMQAIKQSLLSLANTQYLGRNIFAGTSDASSAYNPDYSFNGTAGATVQRRVGPSTTVQVDTDGSSVFGSGSSSVFALIDTITSDIASGNNVASQLTSIDAFMSSVQGAEATVGAAQNQLQTASSTLTSSATSLQASQSNLKDVDTSQVILEMQTQQVAYQTALAVTAHSLQSTLMDYLK